MYQVLYRKWRPRTFSQVVGQPHVTDTLRHALAAGRLSHAYLFTGTRGTGKTSCAKILAKAVNCLHPVNGDPCNECEICKGIDSGAILDVIEIDAASNNGVDNIRDLREETNFTPAKAKYRVYIIDEVHMLSPGAFNALLKTLEEPPSYVIFILATTELHRLPATILSRCQRFDFNRITPDEICQRLLLVAQEENLNLTEAGAMMIARIADGAMRDALSLLDRCSANGGEITAQTVTACVGIADRDYLFEMADAFGAQNCPDALKLIDRLHNQSCDMERLCSELINHLRNLMLCKAVKDPASLILCTPEDLVRYQKQSEDFNLETLLYLLSVLEETMGQLKKSIDRRILMEMTAVRLCSPSLSDEKSALVKRIADLEKLVSDGVPQKAAPAPAAPAKQEAPKPTAPVKQEESKPIAPPPQAPAQPAKPAPAASADAAGDVVFDRWSEVLEQIDVLDKPMTGFLKGSGAFIRGDFLLISCDNPVFEQFIRQSSHAAAVKEAILRVTGRKYRLGIYRKPETDAPSRDPLHNFAKKVTAFNETHSDDAPF